MNLPRTLAQETAKDDALYYMRVHTKKGENTRVRKEHSKGKK